MNAAKGGEQYSGIIMDHSLSYYHGGEQYLVFFTAAIVYLVQGHIIYFVLNEHRIGSVLIFRPAPDQRIIGSYPSWQVIFCRHSITRSKPQ